MTALITVDDIKKYRPIAANITQARILPYILESQVIDLRATLGDKLYEDFMADYSVAKYQTLINGGTYVVDSVTITFPGLVPMLCYFALARFVPNAQINLTAFGLVKKNSAESTPLDAREVDVLASELRSVAISYQDKVRAFLNNDPTTYPYYNGRGTGLNDLGVKFFDL